MLPSARYGIRGDGLTSCCLGGKSFYRSIKILCAHMWKMIWSVNLRTYNRYMREHRLRQCWRRCYIGSCAHAGDRVALYRSNSAFLFSYAGAQDRESPAAGRSSPVVIPRSGGSQLGANRQEIIEQRGARSTVYAGAHDRESPAAGRSSPVVIPRSRGSQLGANRQEIVSWTSSCNGAFAPCVAM